MYITTRLLIQKIELPSNCSQYGTSACGGAFATSQVSQGHLLRLFTKRLQGIYTLLIKMGYQLSCYPRETSNEQPILS